MKKKTINKAKIYYVRESFLQSLGSDIVTMGSVISIFLINQYLLQGRWYIDIFGIWLFLVLVSARSSKRTKRFNTISELKSYLENHEQKRD